MVGRDGFRGDTLLNVYLRVHPSIRSMRNAKSGWKAQSPFTLTISWPASSCQIVKRLRSGNSLSGRDYVRNWPEFWYSWLTPTSSKGVQPAPSPSPVAGWG